LDPPPFDSLALSLSPFDLAQGDPEALEGSKGELAQGKAFGGGG